MLSTADALNNVRYVVGATGEPEFVMVPCQDFRRLVDTLEVEASPELMRSLARARRQTAETQTLLTQEEVFGDL